MMRRPSKSPFFTPAEQVGQQFIREESSNTEQEDGNQYDKQYEANANRMERRKTNVLAEIEELEVYIADLNEEIGVIDVTLDAAEGSGGTESNLYKQQAHENNRLKGKLLEAEKELGVLKNELSKYF